MGSNYWSTAGQVVIWGLTALLLILLITSIVSPITIKNMQTRSKSFSSENVGATSNHSPEYYLSHPKVKKYLRSSKRKKVKSIPKRKRTFSFQRYDGVPIHLDETPYQDETLFRYEDLKSCIDDPEFLQSHYEAVMRSLSSKYETYNRMLAEVDREVQEATEKQAVNAANGSNLDTATTRLQRQKVAIEQIIREIPERIAKTTRSSLQRELRRALYDEESGLESLIGRPEMKDYLALQLYSFTRNPDLSLIHI